VFWIVGKGRFYRVVDLCVCVLGWWSNLVPDACFDVYKKEVEEEEINADSIVGPKYLIRKMAQKA